MNSGELRYRAEIFALEGSPLSAVLKNKLWCGVTFSKSGGEQISLRASFSTSICFRKNPTVLIAGRFIVIGSRIYVIDSVSTNIIESSVSATELIGEPATYTPIGGAAKSTIAFYVQSAPYQADDGSTIFKNRIDIPKLHITTSPKVGDTILFRGQTWSVVGVPDGGDDGVVMQLMVRR